MSESALSLRPFFGTGHLTTRFLQPRRGNACGPDKSGVLQLERGPGVSDIQQIGRSLGVFGVSQLEHDRGVPRVWQLKCDPGMPRAQQPGAVRALLRINHWT